MDFNLFKAQFSDNTNGTKVISLMFLNLVLPKYCIEISKKFRYEFPEHVEGETVDSTREKIMETAVENLRSTIKANVSVFISNQRKEITIETLKEFSKTIAMITELCLKKV